MEGDARQVYPWHWPTVEAVYQWLNSYLGHFRKASSYRLVERLWQRFPWLEEYFVCSGLFQSDGERVAYAFSSPRSAFRISQQRGQFSSQLPGHILVVQMGSWWELWGGHPAYPLSPKERWFHKSRLPTIRDTLWESGVPVAWIRETGRRVTSINERAIVGRWPGVADQRPLSLLPM
jgi:hypothetical protein